jgi:hypothetical protein
LVAPIGAASTRIIHSMLGASKQNGLGRRNSSEPGIPASPGGFGSSSPELAYVTAGYVKEDYVEDTE